MNAVVLITGGAGFVGRHLADHLSESSLTIHGMGHPLNRKPNCWPGTWHSADVRDAEGLGAVLKHVLPDYVFHLAAVTKGYKLEDFLTTNVVGTDRLLSAVLKFQPRARVVVAGSAAEYGLTGVVDQPIAENCVLRPVSYYGLSKVAQTLVAIQFSTRHQLDVVCTRTFNLVGPREPDVLVCSAYAKKVAEILCGARPPILEVQQSLSRRDFTDVRDAVRAYWLLAREGHRGEIYNVCSGRSVRVYDVVASILAHVDQRVSLRVGDHSVEESDVPEQCGDSTKLHRRTGWTASIPLEQSLGDLLNWWLPIIRERHLNGPTPTDRSS